MLISKKRTSNFFILSTLVVLMISTSSYAQKNIYKNLRFDQLSQHHEILAILPFSSQVNLSSTIEESTKNELEINEGKAVQEALESYFLKFKKRKKFSINFQNTNKTNSLLTQHHINYTNIDLKKGFLGSQSKQYVNKFIEIERSKPSNLIEIHNRPNYLPLLEKRLNKRNYTIFFHNDPLSMDGSKTIEERKYLIKKCYRIIFNSNWSKKRFLNGLNDKSINSDKLLVFFQSAKNLALMLLKIRKT